MAEILTPLCPQCDSPPYMVLGDGTQAFCGNGKCSTLCWDQTKSVDENLLDTNFIEIKQRGEEEKRDG